MAFFPVLETAGLDEEQMFDSGYVQSVYSAESWTLIVGRKGRGQKGKAEEGSRPVTRSPVPEL